MIVWLNGPFGGGKSTIAPMVAAALPDALVVDPERVGHLLWSQLPAALRKEEFELEPVWPLMTRSLLQGMTAAYGRPLVVPMTVVRPVVFDALIGGLRADGLVVWHFSLLAAPGTIRERLRHRMAERGEKPDRWGELSWEGLQVDRCLSALLEPRFGRHVDTEYRSPAEVTAEIMLQMTAGEGSRESPRPHLGE
ncbi:AAA family ATPase [Paractinoplanes maris]|uniref:AAA family ATPase n=1 Tax=Paractinoplanes maris TaxID=1734446 RepID=UPI002021C39C|nr:hypothetical protein [Actinoplanes maris]